MITLNNLATEQRNMNSLNIDCLSVREIIEIMNKEDLNVVSAVKEGLPEIEIVIKQTIETLKNNGRIVYIGAGTSGRTGIIDAVECGPTFNCSDEFIGLIAGGNSAVFKAVEGAEDSKELGVKDLQSIKFEKKDLLIGIAASGRTPYVIGGIEYAKKIGAKTACVCCNQNTEIGRIVDFPIEVTAGPEVITGSTRLKSGTCQKLIINMISTVTMIGMGKVYKNLMVDMNPTNEKLIERCRNIVMSATDCDYQCADIVLKETNNNIKQAIVMILLNIDADEAANRLAKCNGIIRKAIDK